MEKNPLIKIEKGGNDFKMIDCEVISGDRPALETDAENTQLIKTKLSSKEQTSFIKKGWFTMNNPFIWIIAATILFIVSQTILKILNGD